MDERLRFVARLLEDEKMAALCREFDISRKTGYKIFSRYKDCGLEGLTDRSRRLYRHANKLPVQIEQQILRIKREKPSWGAPKIREMLRRLGLTGHMPAISTVHAVLDRHGLVTRRRQRGPKAQGHRVINASPSQRFVVRRLQGRIHARRSALLLPAHDHRLRHTLHHQLRGTKEQFAFAVFERAFKDFGLPLAIRTDNGVPFASPHALFGLSKLSVWWLRLGIRIERINPGNPQQNGRHERMHLTLKNETTRPATRNFLQQQERFDEFVACFNHERPHQALGMKYPGELYERSPRPYTGLAELEYPFHDRTITVTRCGRICMGTRKINLSVVFAGQNVGVKQVADQVWLVSFMDYDLGFFDNETCRIECAENPFDAKVLPMSPV